MSNVLRLNIDDSWDQYNRHNVIENDKLSSDAGVLWTTYLQ